MQLKQYPNAATIKLRVRVLVKLLYYSNRAGKTSKERVEPFNSGAPALSKDLGRWLLFVYCECFPIGFYNSYIAVNLRSPHKCKSLFIGE